MLPHERFAAFGVLLLTMLIMIESEVQPHLLYLQAPPGFLRQVSESMISCSDMATDDCFAAP